MSRSSLALAAWVLIACAGVACAGPGRSASLSSWRPPEGQACAPAVPPDALPDADALLDVDAVAAELADAGEGYVVLDVRRDTTATWYRTRVMDGTVPGEVRDRVRDVVRDHLRTDSAEPVAAELRVDLQDPPRVRVGPHWACPPAIRNHEEVVRIMEEVGREVGAAGTVVLRIFVEEDGSAGEVQVARSSSNVALDAAMMRAAASVRFHPAVHGGRYVPVWAQFPFNIRVRR